MSAIFRTDSGVFGDIQTRNMLVTGQINVGTEGQTINQYITQQIDTAVENQIDYSVDINTVSGNINAVSGDLSNLSSTVDTATGNIDTISGAVQDLALIQSVTLKSHNQRRSTTPLLIPYLAELIQSVVIL